MSYDDFTRDELIGALENAGKFKVVTRRRNVAGKRERAYVERIRLLRAENLQLTRENNQLRRDQILNIRISNFA